MANVSDSTWPTLVPKHILFMLKIFNHVNNTPIMAVSWPYSSHYSSTINIPAILIRESFPLQPMNVRKRLSNSNLSEKTEKTRPLLDKDFSLLTGTSPTTGLWCVQCGVCERVLSVQCVYSILN